MKNMVAVEVKQKVMKQKAILTHGLVTKVKVIRVCQFTLSHLKQWGQPKIHGAQGILLGARDLVYWTRW